MRTSKTYFERIPVETVRRIAKEIPETSVVQMRHETAEYSWLESYRTALLETDWTMMPKRILAAESAIQARQQALFNDHGGTPAEKQAIADALSGLRTLQKEVAEWHDMGENPVVQGSGQSSPVS